MANFRITEIPHKVAQIQVRKHSGDWCHTCYKASYIKIEYTNRWASIIICFDCATKLLGDLFKKGAKLGSTG